MQPVNDLDVLGRDPMSRAVTDHAVIGAGSVGRIIGRFTLSQGMVVEVQFHRLKAGLIRCGAGRIEAAADGDDGLMLDRAVGVLTFDNLLERIGKLVFAGVVGGGKLIGLPLQQLRESAEVHNVVPFIGIRRNAALDGGGQRMAAVGGDLPARGLQGYDHIAHFRRCRRNIA